VTEGFERRYGSVLGTVWAPPLEARLVRCVAQLSFEKGRPPSYLFTSARRGRCNPDGVECVYFSEDEATASCEYLSYWSPVDAAHQPKLVYFADVTLGHIVDLTDPGVRVELGMSEGDLFGGWRTRPATTPLQCLGAAISKQSRVSAIRYPSAAAHANGGDGVNVVIFRAAVVEPDSLVILGPGDEALERWP
jgi:RES domain-containing protein